MTVGAVRICNVCGTSAASFGPSPAGNRLEVTCPTCGSLERHRFLTQLLHVVLPLMRADGIVLDVAPSPCLAPVLAGVAGGRVVRLDAEPRNRQVDVAASLTRLPLPAGSAEVVLCYHVFEHIPDDRSAMAEVARVLAPGGVAFVQVPWRAAPTDEDPDADEAERVRRFGQADHVRHYGEDFGDRLARAGLRSRVVTPEELAPTWVVDLLRLRAEEKVWLCSRCEQPEPDALARIEDRWPATVEQLVRALGQRSLRLEAEVTELRRRNRRLRRQRDRARAAAVPPRVSLTARVSRRLTRR